MRGKYYSLSIGESLTKIKLLKGNNETLSVLKANWPNLFPNWEPIKFCEKSKTLTLRGAGVAIYMDHIKVEVMRKCNQFLGSEVIQKIRWSK